MLPSYSRVTPCRNSEAPVVLSAWQTMIWTYQDQAVLAANQVREAGGDVRSAARAMERVGEVGVVSSASVAGALAAHEDAHAIDAFIKAVLCDPEDERGRDYRYITISRAAVLGQPIRPVRHDLAMPERIVAKNEHGAPIKDYDDNRNLIGYRMVWRDGLTPHAWELAQAAQAAFHRIFLWLLEQLDGRRFGCHVVQGTGLGTGLGEGGLVADRDGGLTGYEESLTTLSTIRVLRATG